ncbi:MAG: SDR family oxidoreductase [Polyangiaceae bacterium]
MAGLARISGEVAVVSDGTDGGVAEALVSALGRAGLAARVCPSGGYAEARFGEVPAVIVLGGLAASDDEATALARGRDAFGWARAMAPAATERGGIFVTVQDTGGDFGLAGSERAFYGALAGLAKTASLEWPKASVKAIDLCRDGQSPEAIAAAIVEELFEGGPELEVGLRAGRRVTLESRREVAPPGGRLAVGPGSVIVCSGGARGVTASTIIALARATRCRVALLGRTPLREEPAALAGIEDEAGLKRALMLDLKARGEAVSPKDIGRQVSGVLAGREIRGTLAALEAAGSSAVYLACDVQDGASVNAALAEVRQRFGPITGVVHGAGVVADKLIADKTDDQFDFVVSTKIGGLQRLLEATASDPLDTVVLFSSVAARTGNVGQCDYAMANEILNKVAARERRRRGEGVTVTSLGWGPWEAGMVTPSLKRYFEEHGVALIPLEVGAQMMLDELSSRAPASEVVLGGAPRRAAIAGAEVPTRRFDVRVDASRQPYLVDHSIDGTPVLPLVMVVEWFTRAAEALLRDLGDRSTVRACRDLKVFRGVPFADLAGGAWLRVVAELTAPGEIAVSLCDADDERKRRYAAIVEAGPALPSDDSPQPTLELGPFEAPVYGDALFHGPAFQVIRDVVGVGQEGIVGELVGAEAQGWHGDGWRTDPAALDGGLQLAVLWAQHRLGGKGLPTALGALRLHQPGALTGPLTCTVVGRVDGSHRAVSDITFRSPSGRLVARLEGVETHQRS